MQSDSVQVILVCFAANDVNRFMHSYLWMQSAVILLIRSQYAIVRNLQKLNFYWFYVSLRFFPETCSFVKALDFRVIRVKALVRTLGLFRNMQVNSLVYESLACSA